VAPRVGGGGRLATHDWPSTALGPTGTQTLLAHFAESFRHTGRSWTVHGQHGRRIAPDPGLFKTEIENVPLWLRAPRAVRAGL